MSHVASNNVRYSYAESEVSTVLFESDEDPGELPDLPGSQYALGDHVHPADRQGRWRSPRDLIFGSYPVVPGTPDSSQLYREPRIEADVDVSSHLAPSPVKESHPAATDSVLGCTVDDGELLFRELLLSEDEDLLNRLIEKLVFRRDLLLCVDQMDYVPEESLTLPDGSSGHAAQGDSGAIYATEESERPCSSNSQPDVCASAKCPADTGASDTGETPAAAPVPPKLRTPRSLKPIYRSGVKVLAFRGPYKGKCIPVRLPDPSNYRSATTTSGHAPVEPQIFVFREPAAEPSPPTTTSARAPPAFSGGTGEPGHADWNFDFETTGGLFGHSIGARAFGLPNGRRRRRDPRPHPFMPRIQGESTSQVAI
ncbi:hypothetical protein CMUS01_08704 [Colletotrichum musicola]|uniref:Uncharacterized protein n=1 Tax=Colletotrichum musicola TaxID=2175873 RepID=A0A8H6KAS1_9PEZI|nr:hypothetical protein CMUS01_08704 [Colletotrichum musicola]